MGGSKWGQASGRHARGLALLASRPSPAVPLLLLLSLTLNWLLASDRLHLRRGEPRAVAMEVELPTPLGLQGRAQETQAQIPPNRTCGQADLSALRRQLHNVVLVVNIRDHASVTPEVTGLLRAVYGRIFDVLVLLGPAENKALQVEARAMEPWASSGSFSYFFFPRLAARHPWADGYLWIDADVELNYWRLQGANTSRLWLPESPSCCQCSCKDAVRFQGRSPACFDAPETIKKAETALRRMDARHVATYNQSVDTAHWGYPRRAANAFYVPRRLSLAFGFDLGPVLRDAGVPQEAAVPVMMRALEPPWEYDPVLNTLVCLGETKSVASPESQWNGDIAGLAPWSLASAPSRARLLEALRRHDTCLAPPA